MRAVLDACHRTDNVVEVKLPVNGTPPSATFRNMARRMAAGRSGQAVAKIALAFGMEVIACVRFTPKLLPEAFRLQPHHCSEDRRDLRSLRDR